MTTKSELVKLEDEQGERNLAGIDGQADRAAPHG